MDFKVEKFVSNFIKDQFPSFYNEDGENFILFVTAYYEWLEETGNPVREARELFNYRDIDNTVEKFLEYFQKKYLYGIPFQIITNKRFLLKHILDVYRSKGSIQSFKLLFKLIYGEDVEIYLPAEDILKPSDGIWIQPKYLELTDNVDLSNYIGSEIIGIVSRTTAVVESYIRMSFKERNIAVLYISNILPDGGDFSVGEKIVLKTDSNDVFKIFEAPSLLGSLDNIDIISGGNQHQIGDLFKIARNDINTNELISNGVDGLIRSSSLLRRGGLNIQLVKGGFGYTSNSNVFITNNINDKSGSGANFNIGSLVFPRSLTYNTDIIGNSVLADGLINDSVYTYLSNTSSNLTSTIQQSLNWKTETFGSIGTLSNVYNGNNYITSANVFVRSTLDSVLLPGNVSYSSTNTRVYSIDYTGIANGYSNSDVITVVNPGAGGTNATATISTNNSGGDLKITITDYGSNFSQPSSNIIVTTVSGNGAVFKASFLPYVIGTNTKFSSILSNNSVIKLQANISVSNSEKVFIKEVINNTSLFLYSSPKANSTISARYAASPTILPSQFALYSNVMTNFNNEIYGENEVIIAPFSSSNDAVESVKRLSSGFGYRDQEIVKAYMFGSVSNNFIIYDGGIDYSNNETVSFVGGGNPSLYASGRVITNANGTITNITLDKAGSGYDYAPEIVIKSANGKNASIECVLENINSETEIIGKVSLKGIGSGKGYWETTKGFLNSDKYIQDSYYYQDFSYEIRALRMLDSYKNIFYNTFHPVGSELFGKFSANYSIENKYELLYENTSIS